MSLFDHLDDRLFAPLQGDLAHAPAALAALQTAAGVDVYADLKRDDDSTEHLRQSLGAVEDILRHPNATALTQAEWETVPRRIRCTWLQAWLAAICFPDCANAADARGSEPLGTLALFDCPPPVTAAQRDATATRLCSALGLTSGDLSDAMDLMASWEAAIARKREHVRRLSNQWHRPDGTWDLAGIAKLINACHPGLDLRADEVGIIDAGTAIYLIVPDDPSADHPSAARRALSKQLGRFRFERFNHFPMFSHLDFGAADRDTQQRLADALGCSPSDAVGIANRCLMLERRGHLDSYLVHDSWGHIWQALLSDYDLAYDQLSQQQHPLGADLAVNDPIHRWLTLDDCVRPDSNKSLSIDVGMVNRLADGLLRNWLHHLTVPVIAELTADCVEFCLRMDHPEALVSSSAVADRPCKVDLALADMAYFVKQLGKGLDLLRRRPYARSAFADRLAVRLRGRWSEAGLQADSIRDICDSLTDQIIDHLVRRRDSVWQPASAANNFGGDVMLSDLTRVLLNVLSLHTAINDCYRTLAERPDRAKHQRTLPFLFVALYCRRDQDAFWSCDEAIAATALPFIHLAEQATIRAS